MSKHKRRLLRYYFHSPATNQYLIWGSTSPQLLLYGLDASRLPMTFLTETEAHVFLTHWEQNGINSNALKEAQLLLTPSKYFADNTRRGRQRFLTEQRKWMRSSQ